MRILQVTGGLDTGGSQAVAASLAIGLNRRGHEVALWNLGKSGRLAEEVNDAGVTLVQSRLHDDGIGGLRGATSTGRALRDIARGDWDVVHCHLTLSTLAASPASFTRSAWISTYHGQIPGASRRRLTGLLSRRQDRVVSVSQSVREHLIADCAVQGHRTQVIHNGIPDGPLVTAQPNCWPSGAPMRLLCVGRLAPNKGQALLMGALKDLLIAGHRAELTVIGDGPDMAALRQLRSSLGIVDYVHLVGERSDLAKWYAGADAVVVPSQYEGFSLVALEAMRQSLPVVVTDWGGATDVIDEGVTGYSFHSGSLAHLVSTLKRLWDSDLPAMGTAGRERFRREFTLEATVNAYENLYVEVTSESQM